MNTDNKQTSQKRDIAVYILMLIALPSYIYCAFSHWCMCGHMHHLSYKWPHYLNDFFWSLCFITAIVFSIKSSIKHKWILMAVLFFAIISGWEMGHPFLALPIAISFAIVSGIGLGGIFDKSAGTVEIVQSKKTDPWAVISFLTPLTFFAIVDFIPNISQLIIIMLAPPFAVIAGVISLIRIRRNNQLEGKVFGIIGIIISGLLLIWMIVSGGLVNEWKEFSHYLKTWVHF